MFLEEEQYICKNYIDPIKTLIALWPFPVYIHGQKLQNLRPIQLNYKGLLEIVCVQYSVQNYLNEWQYMILKELYLNFK